jgi:hypothetical protein
MFELIFNYNFNRSMNGSSLMHRLTIILIGSNSINNVCAYSNRIESIRNRKYRLKITDSFVLVDYAVP